MVERSMLEPQEIAGTHASPNVHPGEQHRGPMKVDDVDVLAVPTVTGEVSDSGKRDSQVDDAAIEYTPSGPCSHPRTLAENAIKGGYAQEAEQSYPESAPRCMAGTRGAADIGKIPGYPMQDHDEE